MMLGHWNIREKRLENRRQQRAKRRAIAQRHPHPQRHAQVTHRQSESQPAKTPHRAEEIRPPKRAGGCRLITPKTSLLNNEAKTTGQIIHEKTRRPASKFPRTTS